MPDPLEQLFQGIGLPLEQTEEEVRSHWKHTLARLEFAFKDGDDKDAVAARDLISFLKAYDEVAEAASQREDPRMTRPMRRVVEELSDEISKVTTAMLDMAVTRLTAQGRWFTDPGGPDYEAAQSANAPNN